MPVHSVERKLAAILAADVVGYSRLMGEDEAGTLARLKEHRRELIDPKIAEHKGRIVKTTGDGILIEFPSVVEAVACAVAVQRGMAERNAATPEDQRIVFRVGVNLGDIIVEDDDIHGDGVNVAARLEGSPSRAGFAYRARFATISATGSIWRSTIWASRPSRISHGPFGSTECGSHDRANANLSPGEPTRPSLCPTSRRSRCCRSRT